MNLHPGTELANLAHSLYRRGFSDEEVRMELQQRGAPGSLLQDIMTQVKQLRSTRRRNTGFFCCGLGVFLLVAGCMLTFFLYNNGGDIRVVMYGLTTLGVGFTLKGMIDLLGW